jgi:hypothetical protein
MPEVIEEMLAARRVARKQGLLPRRTLTEEEILGWRPAPGPVSIKTSRGNNRNDGMGSIAVAALDYKRGGW